MPKILPSDLPAKEKKLLLGDFYDFVASLNRTELENFFADFLTPSEQVIFARRLRVVKMLLQGHTSAEIRKELKVGVSTVQFIQGWLKKELDKRAK